MNAMAIHLDSDTLYDPFNGEADLRQRVIRAVGDPLARFNADPMRIVRMLRFALTMDYTIDPATYAAAQQVSFLLRLKDQPDRVHTELGKMLGGVDLLKFSEFVCTHKPLFRYILTDGFRALCTRNKQK